MDSESKQGSNHILAFTIAGIVLGWWVKNSLDKRVNLEEKVQILQTNFERNHDSQLQELKESIKTLQTQLNTKVDIIEQKNVHINLINKEFHNLQKNYNRLKKESIFLKDQLHNAQLDIVEFEQENVNLVNQLNDALQHINSLDQIIESEKLSDHSISRIEDDSTPAADITVKTQDTSISQLSEKVPVDKSSNVEIQNLVKPPIPKLPSQISHESLFKSKFGTTGEYYGENRKSVTVPDDISDDVSDEEDDNESVASAKESTKQIDFNESEFVNDLDRPVEKKSVPSIDYDSEDDMRSFASNIIYDENIITNANPPSPMKYDIASKRGHSKTESTFSHKSFKSGKSSKSSNSTKVFINPDNGSEIMVTGPGVNLKRNKSAGKSFGIFHFGSKNNEMNFGTPTEPIITNSTKFETEEDFRYKWVSELETLKNTAKNRKDHDEPEAILHELKQQYSKSTDHHSTKSMKTVSQKRKSDNSSYYNQSYNSDHSEENPQKETKVDDDTTDVLMVDYQRGVVYNKDYNTSSNLIPKLSKGTRFSFKRKSTDKATVERRAVSVS